MNFSKATLPYHFRADLAAQLVAEEHAKISVSAVYRNLAMLEREGLSSVAGQKPGKCVPLCFIGSP
ncbi:MAG: transcriptional repressor [Dialister invisus]